MKKILIVGVLFVLVILSGCVDSTKYDDFAKCLTEKGAVIYGTDWCHFCKDQKKSFGGSFEFIDYVNCDLDKSACQDAGVKGYPAWVIGGELYPGAQKLEKLASLSGCELQ